MFILDSIANYVPKDDREAQRYVENSELWSIYCLIKEAYLFKQRESNSLLTNHFIAVAFQSSIDLIDVIISCAVSLPFNM